MQNMFLVFSSVSLTCLRDAKTTHTFIPEISNNAIRSLFSKHFLLSKSWNIHRWKLCGVTKQCSFQQMSLAKKKKTKTSLGFHSFFHKSTLSNQTQCRKGEVRRFGGEVRFTRFVLACWDQRSWSSMHKLTDGALLRELETSQSSWVSNRTREAISNARHSRPRPPSHIRNLKTQRMQELSWLLVGCFCWGYFMCWSNIIVCGSVGVDVWCYCWGSKTTRNSCHFCQLFLQAPKLHPNQTGHYKKTTSLP